MIIVSTILLLVLFQNISTSKKHSTWTSKIQISCTVFPRYKNQLLHILECIMLRMCHLKFPQRSYPIFNKYQHELGTSYKTDDSQLTDRTRPMNLTTDVNLRVLAAEDPCTFVQTTRDSSLQLNTQKLH